MNTGIATTAPSIRTRFLADHERLEHLLDEILAAFEANDRDEMQRTWTELDTRLNTHLDAEEQLMFPALARWRVDEASTLLAEHSHFRVRLLELGTEVDLHTVRMETVRGFVDALRAHAAREDALLYRWADEHLGPAARADLLARIDGPPRRSTPPSAPLAP